MLITTNSSIQMTYYGMQRGTSNLETIVTDHQCTHHHLKSTTHESGNLLERARWKYMDHSANHRCDRQRNSLGSLHRTPRIQVTTIMMLFCGLTNLIRYLIKTKMA